MKTKAKNNDLKSFLQSLLTFQEFESIYTKLNISKKKLTEMSKKPEKISIGMLLRLSEITGKPIENFIQFLKENSIK